MIDKLKRDGIAVAPFGLTTRQVSAVFEHLAMSSVRNGHVWAKGDEIRPFSDVFNKQHWPMFCHTMPDIVTAPYFFEAALQGYDVAAQYFGEEPQLYSMNAFWTQPAPGVPQYQDTHGWHRDGDANKQLVMFMFGTDVAGISDGAHAYQRGTSGVPDNSLGYHFTQPPQDKVELVCGQAGTCFFSDTNGLHIGIRPSHPRMLAWARWSGVGPTPLSYEWDKLSPVPRQLLGPRYPEDPALQKAIRLVVR